MEKMENISLTGRKKGLEKKPMKFMERIYLPSIVQGLAITFKHLFRKKATIQYLEQKREFSANFRGIHSLKRDEAGKERCTACGLCALSCPFEALTMIADDRKPGDEALDRTSTRLNSRHQIESRLP